LIFESRRRVTVAVLLATLLLPAGPRAKAQSISPEATAAGSAYDAKDWTKSADLYQQIAAADPKNGRAWYRLGVSLHKKGEHEKAIAAFQKAGEAGIPIFLAEYQTALAYASLHNSTKAFEYLEKATAGGFAQPEQMQTDAELQPYRNDPRFPELVELAEHAQKPCDYAPENRQFDFWLGEWSVVTTAGNMPAGTSRIEKILNGCVILENWTSANSGYQGKSYNSYNTSLKRWEQFWADNSQGMIHFYGTLKDGVMDYWTDPLPQPDGKLLKRHLQFIPLSPEKVRQFSQGSNDDGKTWFVEYDFTYNRAK
jgi:tetratricopeptide (TPR) repeat protein